MAMIRDEMHSVISVNKTKANLSIFFTDDFSTLIDMLIDISR